MQLYRFSPIDTAERLVEAARYVNDASSELCKKIVGEAYPIESLTVFAHYFDEFERLSQIALQLGEHIGDTLGPRVKLHEPLSLGTNTITHLRIRQPDPYHAHVGSNDYLIPSYEEFKAAFLADKPNNLRRQERVGYELIEFWDPDYDVLGYVLSEPERSTR